MKITILGFGAVGARMAALFATAGHDLRIGLREPEGKALPWPADTFANAVVDADVVVLAVPFTAAMELLPALAMALRHKFVVDATNPLAADWSPLDLGSSNCAGEELQRVLPESHVVKAFNTVFADNMTEERQAVLDSALTGFAAVETGPLMTARYLEAIAHLNIQLAVGMKRGTNSGFLYFVR